MPDTRVLGVIPARLGAERLPGKPLRELAGKPLIEWVARNAKHSGALDAVVVATEGPEAARLLERIPAPGSRSVTCVYFAAERAPIAATALSANA